MAGYGRDRSNYYSPLLFVLVRVSLELSLGLNNPRAPYFGHIKRIKLVVVKVLDFILYLSSSLAFYFSLKLSLSKTNLSIGGILLDISCAL